MSEPWREEYTGSRDSMMKRNIIGSCPYCNMPMYNPKQCIYCGACISCGGT